MNNANNIPSNVLATVARELKHLQRHAKHLGEARWAGQEGRHEAYFWEEHGAAVAAGLASLARFEEAATRLGVDFRAVYAEMGGKPELVASDAARAFAARRAESVSK